MYVTQIDTTTMADEDSGSSDESEAERPEVMEGVSSLFAKEKYIRNLFEEVSASYVSGDSQEARESLRNFAEENRKLFQAIVFSMKESDQFFEDVEKQFGESGVERLLEINRDFQNIREEILITDLEVESDQRNPLSDYSNRFIQSSRSDQILVHFKADSYELDLVDTRVPLGHLAHLSRAIIESTGRGLERVVEENYQLESYEDVEDIMSAIDNINSITDTIESNLDELSEEDFSDPDQGDIDE